MWNGSYLQTSKIAHWQHTQISHLKWRSTFDPRVMHINSWRFTHEWPNMDVRGPKKSDVSHLFTPGNAVTACAWKSASVDFGRLEQNISHINIQKVRHIDFTTPIFVFWIYFSSNYPIRLDFSYDCVSTLLTVAVSHVQLPSNSLFFLTHWACNEKLWVSTSHWRSRLHNFGDCLWNHSLFL